MQIICVKCGNEKDASEFSLLATSKNGYKKKCKSCVAEYGRQHRLNNLEEERLRVKQYYAKNVDKKKDYANNRKEIIANYSKEYRINNSEAISERRKASYRANKQKRIALQNESYKKRIANDPLFKLKKQVQGLIRDSLRSKGIKKNDRTINILGCTLNEFKLHLESKFEPWMNWSNKGSYNGEPNFGWDIDHIIPSSSATTEEDILKLNHYTNLQPLCSYVNRVVKRNVFN